MESLDILDFLDLDRAKSIHSESENLSESETVILKEIEEKEFGVDLGALSKIETGKKEFDEKCLENLADTFGLDIKDLKTEYFGV